MNYMDFEKSAKLLITNIGARRNLKHIAVIPALLCVLLITQLLRSVGRKVVIP